MGKIVDKHGKLNDEVFTCTVTKDKKVFIFWKGKRVTTLSDRKAEGFIAAMQGAEGKKAQLIMARATKNFKRSNEKTGKLAAKNSSD